MNIMMLSSVSEMLSSEHQNSIVYMYMSKYISIYLHNFVYKFASLFQNRYRRQNDYKKKKKKGLKKLWQGLHCRISSAQSSLNLEKRRDN